MEQDICLEAAIMEQDICLEAVIMEQDICLEAVIMPNTFSIILRAIDRWWLRFLGS
jgi:hypothetical protein